MNRASITKSTFASSARAGSAVKLSRDPRFVILLLTIIIGIIGVGALLALFLG